MMATFWLMFVGCSRTHRISSLPACCVSTSTSVPLESVCAILNARS
ncbi:hypothetical protein ACFPRL_09980 [Pseudoclavibacter helvolus]